MELYEVFKLWYIGSIPIDFNVGADFIFNNLIHILYTFRLV